MKSLHLSLFLAATMAVASVMGVTVRPNTKVSDRAPTVALASAIPTQFGDWRELPASGAQVVNPQTQQMLDQLYSQIVTRTYVNKQGYAIMLSLAYGEDQRSGLQAHMPEVCYPAQGFKLLDKQDRPLSTAFGTIDSRRLRTSLGSRTEPITYWLSMGGRTLLEKHERRFAEIRLALTGQVPDGLLFRISSIDDQSERAFDMHNRFANDLLSSVNPAHLPLLAGLAAKPATPGT